MIKFALMTSVLLFTAASFATPPPPPPPPKEPLRMVPARITIKQFYQERNNDFSSAAKTLPDGCDRSGNVMVYDHDLDFMTEGIKQDLELDKQCRVTIGGQLFYIYASATIVDNPNSENLDLKVSVSTALNMEDMPITRLEQTISVPRVQSFTTTLKLWEPTLILKKSKADMKTEFSIELQNLK
jgi:hypothetical protein